MRIILTLLVVITGTVQAGSIENAFPMARYYPQPVGLLYPGFNVAAGVNAAALPSAGRDTAVQLAYSPGSTADAHEMFGSVAHSKGNIGFSAGYQGFLFNGAMNHGAFVGLGAEVSNFAFGLGLRDDDVGGGVNPMVDAGMIINLKILDLGLVFYDLNGTARLGVGVGSKSGSRFNLEANVLLPPFSNLDSSYIFTLSAQLSVGIAIVHFRTSLHTGSGNLNHTVGLGAWVTKSVLLAVQYTTPDRLVGGVTISF